MFSLSLSLSLSPAQPSPLNMATLSPSSLTNQLPLLAALGLSALSNIRHFTPEQLALLGINPAHVQTSKTGISSSSMTAGRIMGGDSSTSSTSTSILGQRGVCVFVCVCVCVHVCVHHVPPSLSRRTFTSAGAQAGRVAQPIPIHLATRVSDSELSAMHGMSGK